MEDTVLHVHSKLKFPKLFDNLIVNDIQTTEYDCIIWYSFFLHCFLQYIYNWLQEVSKTYFEVILSCLLPHPVEYARVGGHW